ncbi:MAG: DUF2029 domain-containing protein [Alphaproteobacteria bacterium]|nr:DUF2029 domain-containing protein [Alphaproteobacteria bacterium]
MLDAIKTADWLNERRVRDYALIFLAVYAIGSLWYYAGGQGALLDRRGQPLGTDFVTTYAAGVMARGRDAAGAYDHARLHAAEKAVVGNPDIPFFGWYYPPIFFLVAWAVTLLPYVAALIAFQLATFIPLAAVVRHIGDHPLALLVLLAFPGAFVNLGHGQNGFLTAALLGGGLLALRRQPALAGMLFGLLAYKPQFAILIPLALLAGAEYRAFATAAVTVAALSALSALLFGVESWQAFLASTGVTRVLVLEQGGLGWEKIQSVFSTVRSLGGSVALAYLVQALVSLPTAVAVIWIWRGTAPMAVKAAALCAGTLLATPYLLDYDFVVLALPIAWMAREGIDYGFKDWEKSALALAWLLPLVSRGIASASGVQMAPLVLLALFVLIVRRARA